MTFVDANIFIRIIVEDNLEQTAQARQIFSSKEDLFTEDSVIAEIVYVCLSKNQYGLNKIDFIPRLLPLITADFMSIPNKDGVILALELLYKNNLDFVDCLALAYKELGVVKDILSFDKDLNKAS